MKEVKEIKIRYRSGLMHRGEIDGQAYKEYDYDYVSASTGHIKRFNSALKLMMGISGCEGHLLDWLCANMGEKNHVSNNDITRRNFIAFHEKYKKAGNKSYSDHSVKKAFQNLSNSELLVPVVRGVYLVNPLYFFGGDEKERIKNIKFIMEFKAGIDTLITVETITDKDL